MRITDNYTFLPGCCWFCRAIHLPAIDTELDLDGVNSPSDPNPNAITRLYVCVECVLEMGRLSFPARSLEVNRMGELAQARRVALEQSERAEEAEERLAAIAGAIARVTSRVADTAGSVEVPDEGGAVPTPDPADASPLRRQDRPRQGQPPQRSKKTAEQYSKPAQRSPHLPSKPAPVEEINTDFLGDL